MADYTTPEEKERAAEMDAEIIRLRSQRVTFAEIGRLMADKYGRTNRGRDPQTPAAPFGKAYMQKRYLNALAAVPAREVQQHRNEQLELLNQLIDEAYAIAQKDHLAHSNGRVVEIGGEPVLDDGPKLQAIGEIRKLLERMAKVVGSDTPVKQELDLGGAVRYEIVGVDMEKLT